MIARAEGPSLTTPFIPEGKRLTIPTVQILQAAAFRRAYKRLHPNQKADVDAAVQAVAANPEIGEPKKGDLASVFVYKFKCVGQLTN